MKLVRLALGVGVVLSAAGTARAQGETPPEAPEPAPAPPSDLPPPRFADADNPPPTLGLAGAVDAALARNPSAI
ncbi:MAG TPA: hypothetical protein VE987_22950, partial [Polyangiaceae bacterium]|nr:hypothetical protein [Polyangiaceae bacterium]